MLLDQTSMHGLFIQEEAHQISLPTDCQPYSSDTTKAIAAKTISKVNDTDNTTITGVAITYSNGICASTGGAATFTINSWCDPNVKAADT